MADRRLAKLLPVPRWPTAEEAAASRWFSPLRLGGRTAAARTWVPAMVPWRATDDGFVTKAVLDWYRRFAEGEPGVLVVEATGIQDVASGPLLRIGHDRYLEGLAALARTVREASGGRTLVFLQAIDFLQVRRRPTREQFFGRHLAVDAALRERLSATLGEPALLAAPEPELRARLLALPDDQAEALLSERDRESYRQGYRERVTDLHLPRIRELPATLPGLFAGAARRAREAGFDGLELHYAHAYTMASFLSARNDRPDGYGGDRQGRVRLPLEVFAAVRAEVGAQFPVGCRFLGDEVIEGGSGLDDAVFFGKAFARAGFDFLSVSKGGKFEDARQPRVGAAAYPYTGPSGHECMPAVGIDERGPFGRNAGLAATIRAAIRADGHDTPVITAGGIASFFQAEELLASGQADAVAAARQSLADPDWFRKVRLGRGAEVRRCFFTNYCEALDQAHKEVTCQRWDRSFAPGEQVPLTRDGKRRLVPPQWQPLAAPEPTGE